MIHGCLIWRHEIHEKIQRCWSLWLVLHVILASKYIKSWHLYCIENEKAWPQAKIWECKLNYFPTSRFSETLHFSSGKCQTVFISHKVSSECMCTSHPLHLLNLFRHGKLTCLQIISTAWEMMTRWCGRWALSWLGLYTYIGSKIAREWTRQEIGQKRQG